MKTEKIKASSLSARMVEDDATERLKKCLRDAGMIVNAGAGKAHKPTSKNKSNTGVTLCGATACTNVM